MAESVFERFGVVPPRFDDFAWITSRLRAASRLLEFALSEVRSPFLTVSLSGLRLLRRGFTSRDVLLYRLHEQPAGLFVSTFAQSVRGAGINGHFDHIVNNKVVFPHLMKAAAVPAPCHVGTLGRMGFQGADGQLACRRSDAVGRALARHPRLVVKPVKGCKGAGLLFLCREGGSVLANGRPIASADLEALLSRIGAAIVTEFIEQDDYARALHPSTTNTIRLLTLWDYGSGAPFLAAAAQRIGNSRSHPADNFRAGLGGLSAEVDPDSGVLSRAAGLDEKRRLQWFDTHPESGARVSGVRVPHWQETVRAVLAGAGKLSFAPCLAWDLVVTREAFSVVEINGGPGLHVHQVHRPLLADPRASEFYRVHGIGS